MLSASGYHSIMDTIAVFTTQPVYDSHDATLSSSGDLNPIGSTSAVAVSSVSLADRQESSTTSKPRKIGKSLFFVQNLTEIPLYVSKSKKQDAMPIISNEILDQSQIGPVPADVLWGNELKVKNVRPNLQNSMKFQAGELLMYYYFQSKSAPDDTLLSRHRFCLVVTNQRFLKIDHGQVVTDIRLNQMKRIEYLDKGLFRHDKIQVYLEDGTVDQTGTFHAHIAKFFVHVLNIFSKQLVNVSVRTEETVPLEENLIEPLQTREFSVKAGQLREDSFHQRTESHFAVIIEFPQIFAWEPLFIHLDKVGSGYRKFSLRVPSTTDETLFIPITSSSKDWISDETVSHCQLCSIEFGFSKRRHHCRSCGKIFCADCSEYKQQVWEKKTGAPQLTGEVRVCRSCFVQLAFKEENCKQVNFDVYLNWDIRATPNNQKMLVLHSPISLCNSTRLPVEIRISDAHLPRYQHGLRNFKRAAQSELHFKLEPSQVLWLPLLASCKHRSKCEASALVQFRPPSQHVVYEWCPFTPITHSLQAISSPSTVIYCKPDLRDHYTTNSIAPFLYQLVAENNPQTSLSEKSTCYVLKEPVSVQNLLPCSVSLEFTQEASSDSAMKKATHLGLLELQPSQIGALSKFNPMINTTMKIALAGSKETSSPVLIERILSSNSTPSGSEPKPSSATIVLDVVIIDKNRKVTLQLERSVSVDGTWKLVLYSPYLIYNLTNLHLEFTVNKETLINPPMDWIIEARQRISQNQALCMSNSKSAAISSPISSPSLTETSLDSSLNTSSVYPLMHSFKTGAKHKLFFRVVRSSSLKGKDMVSPWSQSVAVDTAGLNGQISISAESISATEPGPTWFFCIEISACPSPFQRSLRVLFSARYRVINALPFPITLQCQQATCLPLAANPEHTLRISSNAVVDVHSFSGRSPSILKFAFLRGTSKDRFKNSNDAEIYHRHLMLFP